MTCGYCHKPIKGTLTADKPYGAMHIACWIDAYFKKLVGAEKG